MNRKRIANKIINGHPTREGAGVHLNRIFGFSETADFDPFLLLDHFGSTDPEDYEAGFPWHPHRGIETITYVLKGTVAHGDSLGNEGVIGPGDVQWMTAGSGIVHQEMPEGDAHSAMEGFQLWANLPSAHKMTAPKYQEFRADEIPMASPASGVDIRVVAGRVDEVQGPVTDVMIQPVYLDVTLAPNTHYSHPTEEGHTAFCFVFEGWLAVEGADESNTLAVDTGHLALFSDGDCIAFRAGQDGARFLLVSGKPLREPVAWAGPIVMNTKEELDLAFEEYRTGRFIKKGSR